MNDPYVLAIYTRLVRFEQDLTKHAVTFSPADHATQDTLHSLARTLGLEYEYSLQFRKVRVSRAKVQQPLGISFCDVGHVSVAPDKRRLPDTPPDENPLSTYAENRSMSSSNTYIEKAAGVAQWEDPLFEGIQNLDIPSLDLELGSYYTPTGLEEFGPGNTVLGDRDGDHGSQSIAPVVVLQPPLNRTPFLPNFETSMAKDLPVNPPTSVSDNGNAALSVSKIQVLDIHNRSRSLSSEDGVASADQAQVSESITEAQKVTVLSHASKPRQSESLAAHKYPNELTFITDTSAIPLKPPATNRRGGKENSIESHSDRSKFAACWKCKALRKRVSKATSVRCLPLRC